MYSITNVNPLGCLKMPKITVAHKNATVGPLLDPLLKRVVSQGEQCDARGSIEKRGGV